MSGSAAAKRSDDRRTGVGLTEDSLYRKVCESMTSGVMLINANGEIETFNQAASEILGLDRKSVLGRSFVDVLLADERFDELNESVLAAVHDGEVGHHRVVHISVGERTVPLSVSTAYLRDPSDSGAARRGVVAVFSDISEVEELRVTELRLRRDLEGRHKELSEAYLSLEDRNRELGSLVRKVQTVRISASVFVVALVVAIGGYLWNQPNAAWFGATAAPSSDGDRQARLFTVEPRRIASTITVASVIRPRREVVVASPIDGQIDKVHVRHGETVDAGQLLLQIDIAKERIQQRGAQTAYLKARMRTEEYSNWIDGIEVAKAKRTVNKARIALEAKTTELEETNFLIEKGLVPARKKLSLERDLRTRRLDLEAAEQELKAVLAKGVEELEVARLDLAGAREELARIDRVLRNAAVVAPVAGVVLRFDRRLLKSGGTLSAGRPVEQGQELLTIGDVEGISVTGWVDEADIGRIQPGQAVRISGPAFPGMELMGKVAYVSSEATRPGGRTLPTFEVAATVDGLDGKQREVVRLGMSADMKIVVYQSDNALLVPVEAVDLTQDRPRLRVWDDAAGAGRFVDVATGTTTTDAVEIRGGIAPGDRVILP